MVHALVVSARVEGADYLRAVASFEVLPGPREDGVVHRRRRVAVVGGQFLPELVDEFVILLVPFAPVGAEALPQFLVDAPRGDAPVLEREVVPAVRQGVPVPGAEGAVVLHRAAEDGLPVLVALGGVDDDGAGRDRGLPEGGEPEVPREDNEAVAVLHDERRTVLEEVLVLDYGAACALHVLRGPLARIAGQPVQLSHVAGESRHRHRLALLSHFSSSVFFAFFVLAGFAASREALSSK